jgi:hypothetical protein
MKGQLFGVLNPFVLSSIRPLLDRGTITFPTQVFGAFYRNVPLTGDNIDEFRQFVTMTISDARELNGTSKLRKWECPGPGVRLELWGYRLPWTRGWLLINNFHVSPDPIDTINKLIDDAPRGNHLDGLDRDDFHGEKSPMGLLGHYYSGAILNGPSGHVTLDTMPSLILLISERLPP